MEPALNPVLYIRLRKRIRVRRGQPVYLGQTAQPLTEPEYEERLSRIILCRPQAQDGNIMLIDMLQVVRKVREAYPSCRLSILESRMPFWKSMTR
ncbi:stage V sporulation protein AA [Paenibacillus sp. P25]|nr:stage V sporulation protein AA [Paenibacillus sp. P25]